MSDRYVEITRRGFGQNLMNSVVGVLIGLVMFILAFPVLWWNQGRINLGKVAETSIPVTSVEAANDGQLVAAAGTLTIDGTLGDEPYLDPGDYVLIERKAEMYAWVEHKESSSKDKVGGGTETTTTYTYQKDWTSSPEQSSGFRHPEGHRNPEMPIKSTTRYVPEAKVGPFSWQPADCKVSATEDLTLSPDIVDLTRVANSISNGWRRPRLEGDSIYIGPGTPSAPDIGDLKISFRVRRPGTNVTVFGQQQGGQLTTFVYKGKAKLFRLFDVDRAAAIEKLKVEHKILGWAIGIGGFLLMWIGMTMVFGPLIAVAKIIPFLGQIGERAVGCATFPLAAVLSLIIVFVSKVVHSPIVMLILGVVVTVGLFVMLKQSARRD